MKWLTEVIVDIAVTGVIVWAVVFDTAWLEVAIAIYAGLMLVAKIVVYARQPKAVMQRMRKSHVPAWFYHLVYCVNIACLVFRSWWIPAIEWGGIWLFSWLGFRNLKGK